MTNSSMITGRRCVDEEADKWFIESLFKDYRDYLYVLSWANWSMLAFGSVLCCLFWGRYRSFRVLFNYILFNMLFCLSIFNAAKIMQLFWFEQATLADKQTGLFLIRLSMGWFSSWFFVVCIISCLNHAVKGVYVLNHKYWKTNMLAVGFALLLTLCPSYLSAGHYPALLALVTMPGYVAYLSTLMTFVEMLVSKEKNETNCRLIKSFTYRTCALFILVTMQFGEYAPKRNNYTWLCMVVLQMFLFVFYLATGDFHNMQMQCQKEQLMPIVGDAKKEVELVTVVKDVK